MLHHEFIEKLGVNYIIATEPFSLQELFALLASSSDKEEHAALGCPTVLDLSRVNIARIETSEIRRHIMKKSTLESARTAAPCAYLVSGMAAFSMVRMALVYAELAGTSPEDMTFITEVLSEAAQWIAEILSADAQEVFNTLENIARPTDADVTHL